MTRKLLGDAAFHLVNTTKSNVEDWARRATILEFDAVIKQAQSRITCATSDGDDERVTRYTWLINTAQNKRYETSPVCYCDEHNGEEPHLKGFES